MTRPYLAWLLLSYLAGYCLAWLIGAGFSRAPEAAMVGFAFGCGWICVTPWVLRRLSRRVR